jgi:hypothetical protein
VESAVANIIYMGEVGFGTVKTSTKNLQDERLVEPLLQGGFHSGPVEPLERLLDLRSDPRSRVLEPAHKTDPSSPTVVPIRLQSW